MSKESPGRPQRGLRLPQHDQRRFRETCRWSCTLSADRRYVPAAGAGDISTVCTIDLFSTVLLKRTLLHRSTNSEFDTVSEHELCVGVEHACTTAADTAADEVTGQTREDAADASAEDRVAHA